MRGKLVLILLIFSVLSVKGQQAGKPFMVESRFHAGMNLPFYKALDYLIEDDLFAFDLMLRFPSTGKDPGEKLFHYPATGLGYSWWSLGNNEVLGHAHAIYGFISFPVRTNSSMLRLNLQTSSGAAYITRKFDIYANHLNRAIGSSLNIYIRLGFDARIRINPRSELVFEAGTSHFSNGKTRSPNYGINTGSVSTGICYFINSSNYLLHDPDIPPVDRRIIQTLRLSAGRKVYDDLTGTRYLSSTLSYDAERYVNHTGIAGLGADIFYDGSISEGLAAEKRSASKYPMNLMRIGFHGSYAIRYKKFQPGLQLGYYIYSKYTVLTNIYTRILMQYSFTDKISASVSVRSHWGKADALEYGLGYTW